MGGTQGRQGSRKFFIKENEIKKRQSYGVKINVKIVVLRRGRRDEDESNIKGGLVVSEKREIEREKRHNLRFGDVSKWK